MSNILKGLANSRNLLVTAQTGNNIVEASTLFTPKQLVEIGEDGVIPLHKTGIGSIVYDEVRVYDLNDRHSGYVPYEAYLSVDGTFIQIAPYGDIDFKGKFAMFSYLTLKG